MQKDSIIPAQRQNKPPEIDWHAQWSGCGWTERDGYFEVDLRPMLGAAGGSIKMLPGAGFGDLSHVTTALSLQMMALLHMPGKTFIDIGCGSGILSIAAAKLGAKKVIGIDIDPLALHHAAANAKLNGFDIPLSFVAPGEMPALSATAPLLFAMNMIYTEQQVAWESLPKLHIKGVDCITSGILAEQKAHYLAICDRLGWRLVAVLESGGWLAFHFIT